MTAFRRSGVLLAAASIISCVGDAPIAANEGDADGGNGGGTATASIDTFLGTWTTKTATQTVTGCSYAQTNKNVEITLKVTKGKSGDIAMTNTLAPSCSIEANISGNEATVIADQRCTDSSNGVEYEYSQTSSFRLTNEDGTAATVRLDATMTLPSGETCSFTESDPYARSPE